MVGDQANPALALAQGLGVLVAFGDVGEGVDETAGGQRMGTDFQDPTVVQPLFQLLHRAPIAIAAGRGQQAQLAVGDHFGEGPMGRDRGQAAEFEKAPVPQLQHALGVDHGHTLGKIVHGALQQVRLLRHGLFAAHGFAVFDVSDVGEQDDSPTVLGWPFADLQPAAIVPAIQQVFVSLPARLLGEQPGGEHQAFHFAQAHAGVDPYPAIAPEGLEAAVEQDDALLGIEQYKGIGNALDGIDQVLVRGFRPQACFAEQAIARLELGHRLVQGVGAFAHLFGQHHRMLECPVRVVATGDAGFDAFDQRRVDAPQFLVFVLKTGNPGLLRLNCVRGSGFCQWQPR
ncbi:hypothetical protein D3C73_992950 [compost metagenome]